MNYNKIAFPGNALIRLLLSLVKYNNYSIDSSFLSDGLPQKTIREMVIIRHCENRRILELFSELQDYSENLSVFIHGSWSDNTQTPFSDIDDFVVIDDFNTDIATLKEIVTILNKIDMSFCRIDPLQHHGHWITSKSELLNYDNSFIPLFILNDAKKVIGDQPLKYNIDTNITCEGLKNNIVNTCKSIDKLSYMFFNNNINCYSLKCFVGSFVLMPAFIFQLQGLQLNKPTAIKRSSELFTEKSFELIKWSTECRANWHVITNEIRYKLFSLLPRLFLNPHMWRRFAQKFSPAVAPQQLSKLSNIKITESDVQKFISESLAYVE